MNLNTIAFILLIAFGVGMAFYVFGRGSREEAWKKLANELNLKYEERDFRKGRLSTTISGIYRGKELLIQTIRKGGEVQALYTEICLPVQTSPNDYLLLTPNDLSTRAVKLLGVKYAQVGDGEFDRRFAFRCRPEGLAAGLFKSAYLRQRLMKMRRLSIAIERGELKFDIKGMEKDFEALRGYLDLIYDVAEAAEVIRG
jgi:hypothetical protein